MSPSEYEHMAVSWRQHNVKPLRIKLTKESHHIEWVLTLTDMCWHFSVYVILNNISAD